MADEELEALMSGLSAGHGASSGSREEEEEERAAAERAKHVGRFPADAIEFCPAVGLPGGRAVAALAGYKLHEHLGGNGDEQVKVGGLEWLVAAGDDGNISSSSLPTLLECRGATAEGAAVLDVRWQPPPRARGSGADFADFAEQNGVVFPLVWADSAGCVRFCAIPYEALCAVAAEAEEDEENRASTANDPQVSPALLGNPLAAWTEGNSCSAVQVAPGEGCMALSVDWHHPSLPASPYGAASVVASTSDGVVAVAAVGGFATDLPPPTSGLPEHGFGTPAIPNVAALGAELTVSWKAHDFEAWIAASHYSDPNIIYSGGDDCAFRVWDVRTAEMGRASLTKRFDMGVTGIQHSPHPAVQPHLVAVGSYDESVSLLDCRMLARPLTVVRDLGGAGWRIKWHPSDPWLIAVPCMRAGFRVLRFTPEFGDDGFATAAALSETFATRDQGDCEPIGYGIDWHPNISTGTLATCSFYDCIAQLWTP